LALVFSAAGCGRGPFAPNQQQQQALVQQQMQAVAQQNQEYQSRASSLDRDNQELESLLAQSRQQIQLQNDELAATRQQLQTTTDQLVAMRSDNERLKTSSSQLVATVQQRAGAEIRANNTMLKNLAIKQVPGVEVRPTHSQQFPTPHHLSAAQALAVYNVLVQRGTMPAQQLFVIGHGANHPIVSGATDAGKARNRRIEFVVYPERMASR
jgi:flagellar motor protein MotB